MLLQPMHVVPPYHSILFLSSPTVSVVFFFNDTATTEIYTLSLHDALPISAPSAMAAPARGRLNPRRRDGTGQRVGPVPARSEEHTSELQSRQYLVCRLLLEKKKHSLHDQKMSK